MGVTELEAVGVVVGRAEGETGLTEAEREARVRVGVSVGKSRLALRSALGEGEREVLGVVVTLREVVSEGDSVSEVEGEPDTEGLTLTVGLTEPLGDKVLVVVRVPVLHTVGVRVGEPDPQ
jgi:hypothetical protein